MEKGIRNRIETVVGQEMSARSMKSGTLDVLATPSMVALMEETAWRSVAPFLGPGRGTVGTVLELSHLSPTPLGMAIWCESELVEVDGRRLVFRVEVHDERGLVGKGRHERFIVDEERFQAKADAK